MPLLTMPSMVVQITNPRETCSLLYGAYAWALRTDNINTHSCFAAIKFKHKCIEVFSRRVAALCRTSFMNLGSWMKWQWLSSDESLVLAITSKLQQ